MRKRYFGDRRAAQEYTRDAAKLLDQVKLQMQFQGLRQLSRRIVLANGVVLMASSVFGQDEVQVHHPGVGSISGLSADRDRETLWKAVGYVLSGIYKAPAVWDRGGKLTTLGTLPGFGGGFAQVVSTDCQVVAGICESQLGSGPPYAAFRYINGSMSDMQLPKDGTGSFQIEGISRDGGVIVGTSPIVGVYAGEQRSFVWTPNGGTQYIPKAAGESVTVKDVSDDGRYAVGYRETAAHDTDGFRYNVGTGAMEFFPSTVPNDGSSRYQTFSAVSTDGSVMVGSRQLVEFPIGNTAIIRNADGAYLDITQTPNFKAGNAAAVSGDGKTVCGTENTAKSPWRWTSATGKVILASEAGSSVNCIAPDGTDVGGWAYRAANGDWMPVWWDVNGVQHWADTIAGASGQIYDISTTQRDRRSP